MKRVFSFALALFLILILLVTLIVGLSDGPDGVPLLHALTFIDIIVLVMTYGFSLITYHTRR